MNKFYSSTPSLSSTILILLIIFFNNNIANIQATDNEQCRSGCRGSGSSIFKYADGTTYKYNFDSKIDVTLSSAEGQKTSTEIKGTVLLTQQSDCNQILRVQNVQIIGNDNKKISGTIPNIDKPIKLNFHDGHIEDSICTEPDDTQHSLNVKRAVASLFQINLKNGHETDVFGLCPTEVNQHLEGNILIVQKSRNLNKCAYRESIKQDFLTTTFNLNSEIRSSPILNSDFNGKFKIKNGQLDNVHTVENYLYMPFSVGNKGAKAMVETKLQLVGTSKDVPQTKCTQPRSIIFEDPHPVNSPKSNVNSILNAVKDAAKTIGLTVGQDTAKEFLNLIRIIRVSNKDDLLAVYNQVRAGVGFMDKMAAKKLFLDAILRAGNADTVEVALELLKNKELNLVEQKLVYLGLTLVRHTSESTVNAAVSFLNQQNLPREAYLGIGSLIGRHCKLHKCKDNDAITKALQKIVGKLGDGKATDKQHENELIYLLKAISNVHQIPDNGVQKIIGMAQDKKASNRLRVTALEALLSDPCKDKIRDSCLAILKDIQQDSEVRIKAYLVLAQCPNAKIGNAIKSLIGNEPSYQVGGFIVSHIKNIRSSANPDKYLQKQHLSFINLPKKYPIDFRKYSYSGELSYSVDTLGMANSLESNLIYSQQSFLPRSINFNLTSEVFGHTFNLLEINSRQENLDKLMEHYFGPRGLLRTQTLQQLWDTKGKRAQEILDNLKERLNKSLRAKRDTSKSEIDQIGKQVQIKTNELNKDFDLDVSLKAFGTEMAFININDNVRKYTPEMIIDRILTEINGGIDGLKDFEQVLRSNLLLIDAELSYPTLTGFPLRLGVEASSNVQIKASGQIDLRNLLMSKTNGEDNKLKLSLIPSANVLVSGRLTLDTFLHENGLKVSSNLHTATGGEIAIELFNNNHGIDIKMSLPLDKQDLISASHDIVFHTRELGVHEHNVPLKFAQNKDFSICFDQLNSIIGLTFCGEINGPNLSGKQVPILPYPLAGDSKVSITIEKEDVSEYHFRAVDHNKAEKIGYEVSLGTYNKNKQTKVNIALEAFLVPEKIIKLILTSPIKKAELQAKILNEANEKAILAKFSHDNMEYSGKIGIGISGSDSRLVYKPILEYKTPQDQSNQIPPYHVEGQVIVEKSDKNTKYILDNVKLIIPNQKTISVNGNFGHEDRMFFQDITASDGTNSASVKYKIQFDPNYLKLNGEYQNTMNPNINLNIKGELHRSLPYDFNGNLQVIHGQDLSSKTNILTVATLWKYQKKDGDNHDYHIETKNKVTYPLVGLNANLEYEVQPKKMEYDFNVDYNDMKFGSELEADCAKKNDGDFTIEFGVWGLGQKLSIDLDRQKLAGDESTIKHKIEMNNKKLEINGKIKHHIKPHDINIGSDLIIKSSQSDQPITVQNGLKYNPNEIDLFHKTAKADQIYVDLFLKANKHGDAACSIAINLEHVHVNGKMKCDNGQGSADILIDLPTLKKQMKADTMFKIQKPNYNVVLNVYPIYHNDKTKKITISTENSITMENMNSKNLIDVMGQKMEFNMMGERKGEPNNGQLSSEFELIPPNNHYVLVKFARKIATKDGTINGNAMASVEHRDTKDGRGAIVSLKATITDTNPKEKSINVEYNLVVDNGNGKNINGDISIKRVPSVDGSEWMIHNKIHGSVLKHEFVGDFHSKRKGRTGNYHIKSNYGSCCSMNIKGNVDLTGEGNPLTGDISMEMNSESDILKTLKFSGSGSLHKTDHFDVKGAGSMFAESAEKKIIDISGNGELRLSDKDGKIKGSFKDGHDDPIAVDMSYTRQYDENQKKLQSNLAVQYGKGQNIKGSMVLVKLQGHEYKLNMNLDLPTEKHRSNQIQVHTKRSDDNKNLESQIELISDGQKWTLDSNFVFSQLTPTININGKCPDGKTVQIYGKINKITDKQLTAEMKLINEHKDFILESNLDTNVENADNFYIKANIHCPKLKMDKISFEAHNKPSKSGRRIQINAKSDKENLLSGSTSYQAREEKGKLIIEGSGSFKIKEETKSGNFKYIRQNLEMDKNGENGMEISFDAGLGNKAVDAELKLTNKQFRILNSYCEEKKQCAHIEIDSKIHLDNNFGFNHELEVAIDLRKLGLSHEFGLKSVTTRKEHILDHTVDIHFQSGENSKYQYSLYAHPQKAGVSLTTPKRIISLEAQGNLPKSFKEGGKYSGDISFYLDKKNKPNEKSSVIGFIVIEPTNYKMNGEVQLTSPGLQRPMTATFQSQMTKGNKKSIEDLMELDIFANPNQKLLITYKYDIDWTSGDKIESNEQLHIKSDGLKINIKLDEKILVNRNEKSARISDVCDYNVGDSKYLSEYNWELSPKSFQILLKILNVDLIRINSQIQLTKDMQIIDSDIMIYGIKPYVNHFELKNFNTMKFYSSHKDKPNNKFQINSGFIPGQIADLRAIITKDGANHELVHATLQLDEANFLKPDYGLDTKNIQQHFIKHIQGDLNDFLSGLKDLVKRFGDVAKGEMKNLNDFVKEAQPNIVPVQKYYTDEMLKLKEEILSDKTIREISELLQSVISAVLHSVSEVIGHVSKFIENVSLALADSFGKIFKSIQADIIPKLKENAEKLITAIGHVLNKVTDIIVVYVAQIMEIIEKYQPEIKQITTNLSEIGQDLGRFLMKAYERLSRILIDQYKLAYNELKALPLFDELKHQYQNLIDNGLIPNREALVSTMKDMIHTVKDIVPSDEMKKLIELIGDYLEKKISNQVVNDVESLEKIYSAGMNVVRKVLALITQQYQMPDLSKINIVSLPLNIIGKLPRLVAAKFSPITYLMHEMDSIAMVLPFGLSLVNTPRNLIAPFPLYGMVLSGQHIFTFDGKHLTIPSAKCDYLLARDAYNGNFTLVAAFDNTKISSITLADRSGDMITFKRDGIVLVNGQRTELPARKQTMAAYADYEIVTLISTYGVTVICPPSLMGCAVRLSGFYHGQTRGLLGDGNNEPYDDFVQANGKIVSGESDFVNSYKMNGQCTNVKLTMDHHHHHTHPECEKLFGWESKLRYCYPFVDTDNFRMACEHGMAAGIKDTEEVIATGYVAACNQHGIPIRVPSQFLKCKNGETPREIGDKFSVKTPNKMADIVLMVETVKENEQIYKELVQPLVEQLTSKLNAKGISDVNYHLIAWGGENHWPSHITVDNKMIFKTKPPTLTFKSDNDQHAHNDHEHHYDYDNHHTPLITGCKQVDNAIEMVNSMVHDLKLALGLDLQAQTYEEGLNYPFRAEAVKSAIAVVSHPCETGRFLPIQILRTLLYQKKTTNLNLITPIAMPSTSKQSTSTNEQNRIDITDNKDLIGFNRHHMFTLSEGITKTATDNDKSSSSSSSSYKNVNYNDFCIDFTINNNGNVFLNNNFNKNRKQYVKIVSEAIVAQLTANKIGLDCECKYVTNYNSQNICHIVNH